MRCIFAVALVGSAVAAQAPACPHYVGFPGANETSTEPTANYTFVGDTQSCDALLPRNSSDLPPCADGDLVVELGTVAVLPNNSNIMPYLKLNFSATSHVPIEQLIVQFKCTYSTNVEDPYCNEASALKRKANGEIIWPCRAFALNQLAADADMSPLLMRLECFHLYSLSQYELNVTVLPQMCRNTYLVTIPYEPQVELSFREYEMIYHGWKKRDASWWSPMVFIDLNNDHGVWFHFEPPKAFHVKELTVAIYSESESGAYFVRKEKIAAPKTGVKWTNVDAGDYYALAYVDRHDCSMDCLGGGGQQCLLCPYTLINFTVPVDKFTPEWRRYQSALGVAKTLAMVVLVTLIILVISLAAVVFYLREIRPRQLARRPPQSVELTARPSVLILYADDCAEHSNAVMALAHLLERHANANVLIDQTAFADPATRPSIWLMNAISSAQYILVLFSDATQRIIAGERLVQRRPFPDQFNTAIRLVVSKINETLSSEAVPVPQPASNGSSLAPLLPIQRPADGQQQSSSAGLKRFLVARFAYSHPQVVPEFFRLLKCAHLVVPDDMGRFIGCLHGVDTDNAATVEFSADMSELQSSMDAYRTMAMRKPDFLSDRFIAAEESDRLDRVVALPETIPLRPVDRVPDAEEMRRMIEKYGLPVRPEDMDSDEEQANHLSDSGVPASVGPQKYQLVGTLDDISDSD